MDVGFRLTLPPTTIAAPGVIWQIRAGNQPLHLTCARLGQITKLTSEIWRFQWTIKSPAATAVVTHAPSPNSSAFPTAGASRTETGYYAASGSLGTDSADRGWCHWNLVNGEINDLLLPSDNLELQSGEILALNLISIPLQSTSIAGYLGFVERW